MGITGLLPALKSIQVTKHLKEFAGKTVAVDGYVWLHRGVHTCATELATGKPTHKYVDYAMRHVRLLQHHGIEPYLVFDGGPLPAKRGTEDDRKQRRDEARTRGDALAAAGKHSQARDYYLKSIDVSPQMAYQFIKALRAESISFVVAPYEADAQLAYLERTGVVDAILTEDSDLLVFGCQNVLFKFDAVASTVVSISRTDFGSVCSPASEISLVGWSDVQFRAMAILSGCDYLPSIPGIGLKTACTLLRKHKTAERVVKMIQLEGKKKVPRNYFNDFKLADKCFQHQRVYCPLDGKLVYLTEVEGEWAEEEEAYVGGNLDSSLAKALALGDVDPVTLLPIEDINPAFAPRIKPLSKSLRSDKGKGKAVEKPAKEGILSFFGPNPTIPPRSREIRRPLSPIRPKKITAGKDSGKRTLAEVMDRDMEDKRKQRSKFFDPRPRPTKESDVIAGPSRQHANKENICHVISDDEDASNVSIEARGDAEEDLAIDLEEPTLIVTQEDGYMSPTSACSEEMQDLSSPIRPGLDSSARRRRSPDHEFEGDAVSSPPAILGRRRRSNSPPQPISRTNSLDLTNLQPSHSAASLSCFIGPDLQNVFADDHSTDIECSDNDEPDVFHSNSPTPPAATPPTPTRAESKDNIELDDAEDPMDALEHRKQAVITGWRQRWSITGQTKPHRASLPNLARRETNVTPSGRHTIPHPGSRLARSCPYPKTAPSSASKLMKPRRAELRKSLSFLTTVKRPCSPGAGMDMALDSRADLDDIDVDSTSQESPSGLRTHMNTHNNVKPFPCEFQGCTRTFTVRSNAKRHLRTHGVENTSASFRTPTSTPYVVDFDEPKVLTPNAAGTKELPPKLRWLPPSLSSRTNASLLVSLSDDDSSDDEGGLRQDHPWRVFNLPCSPVVPTTPERGLQERFEERDSYKVAPLYPYHPSQFRVLPGPAVQPSIAA
ncbi:hypothetical protein H0H93_000751 [Arthromyces matolae]|nr:hypothetical protein H0H93_000751 [Arthromyces matolae]